MRWPWGVSPLQSPLALKTETPLWSAHGECWSVQPTLSSRLPDELMELGFQVALSELFLSIFPAPLFALLSGNANRIMLHREPIVTSGEIVRFRPLLCQADVSDVSIWYSEVICGLPCASHWAVSALHRFLHSVLTGTVKWVCIEMGLHRHGLQALTFPLPDQPSISWCLVSRCDHLFCPGAYLYVWWS